MTTSALHPVPAWGVAFREQLRVVGAALRGAGILLVAATALLMWGAIGEVREYVERGTEARLFVGFPAMFGVSVYPSGLAPLLAFAALFVPVAVWRGADPARRAYHAAMPLPEASHTLLKVGCGWIWAVAGVALVQLAIYGTAQLAIRIVRDIPDTTVGYPGVGDVPWQWTVPFVAATIGYLIGSAFTLGSRYPARLIMASFVALFLVGGIFGTRFSPLNVLFQSRLGLTTAINGTRTEIREVSLPRPAGASATPRADRAEVGAPAITILDFEGTPARAAFSLPVAVPDLGRWLPAASLWLAIGVGAVTLAARHRRE